MGLHVRNGCEFTVVMILDIKYVLRRKGLLLSCNKVV